MKIDTVNVYKILLPFSGEFSHALRKRHSVKNIIIEVIAEDGKIKGYGEGAPRSYVTGESQEGVARSLTDLIENQKFPWTLNSVSQIWDFVDSLPKGKDNNSAICALEMSLLDLFGKDQNRYLTDYFPKTYY
ncbi:hypothetical protein OAC89_06835, partial [Deltaproteobacteria bacterium]|nr:hypothetical protein [Deltaproteobacteria bacterium]